MLSKKKRQQQLSKLENTVTQWILFGVNENNFYTWGKFSVGIASSMHTLSENLSQNKKIYLFICISTS